MNTKQILKGIALAVGLAVISGCGGGSTGANGPVNSNATTGSCPPGGVSTMYGCQAVSPICNNTAAFVNGQCVNGSTITPIPTPTPIPCAAGTINVLNMGCQVLSPICNNTGAWINNQCMGTTGPVPTPPPPPQIITSNNVVITCQGGYLFTGMYGCQPAAAAGQNCTGPNQAFFNNSCMPAAAPQVVPTCQGGFLYVGTNGGCKPVDTTCGSNMALNSNGQCVNAIITVQAAVCTLGQVYTTYGCLPTCPRNPSQGFIAATNTCYPSLAMNFGMGASQFNAGPNPNGQYNNGQYNNGQYNNGQYNNGQYNNGQYNNGQYNNGQYNNGQYNNGQYNNGQYNNGQYPNMGPGYYTPVRPGINLSLGVRGFY